MHLPTILIVDDAQHEIFLLAGHLEEWGYRSLSACNGVAALDVLRNCAADLIVSDQEMDGMNGIELLQRVKHLYPLIPFIMLTAYGNASRAVAAMKRGADDYVLKPYVPDEFHAKIARLLKYPGVLRCRGNRQDDLEALPAFQEIITASPNMISVLTIAAKVVKSPDTTILIFGESGTGKGRLSRTIHRASGGSDNNFVHVSCAAIPAQLLESELFGHVKGAFTGAVRDKTGKFDSARGGTLLLDEIDTMPLELQAKLLRALQERTYEPVGGHTRNTVACRIMCATNQELRALVHAGQFREDLYYRINVFPITVPPLRDRKSDIPLLANHFFEHFHTNVTHSTFGISQEAMENLCQHHWPGNVRELENCMERAVILAEESQVRPQHLTIPKFSQTRNDESGLESGFWYDEARIRLAFECNREQFSLESLTNHVLHSVLDACGGNISQAAAMLGINRKMFYRRKLL